MVRHVLNVVPRLAYSSTLASDLTFTDLFTCSDCGSGGGVIYITI